MVAPDKRDRKRPAELLILTAVLSLFVLIIAFMSTRDVILAVVFAGIVFIVTLVVLAMLSLAIKPTGDERADLDEQDRGQSNGGRPSPH